MLNRKRSDFDLVVPDDRERHRAYIASLTPEHPSETIVIRCRTLINDDIHWEEWTDTGIFDSDGKLVEIQAIGRDVTEKKEAQEALSASEARMSAFLNYAPVAMLAKDMDGHFTMANPEALKRLKKTATEVIGKTTVSAIESGLYYGYVGLVDGMVRRIQTELGQDAVCIATGGLAAVIAPEVEMIEAVDPDLTLQGLRMVWERNRP